jgi:repressor LexA
MARVSQRRQQILRFIREFIERKGYPPTVRDILRGCNISSPAVVQHHLKVLEDQGHIRREPGVRRSITLADRPGYAARVPLLGRIAAGQPIPVPQSDSWHEEPLEMLEVPAGMVPAGEGVYALQVRGLSMIDALIDDGDIVIMQAASTVNDGETAAVWLRAEQEVTLKRVYRERGRVRLQPANRQMEPMYHDPGNVEVQGRVIGVIRALAGPVRATTT